MKKLLLLLLVLIAFHSYGSDSTKIRASMYAVPEIAGTGFGTTEISWFNDSTSNSQVWVSVNGGGENLFAGDLSGKALATWITNGNSYKFRLYGATGPNAGDRIGVLDSLTVTGIAEFPVMAGMNKFDLLDLYIPFSCGCSPGLDSITGCVGPNQVEYRKVVKAMALKSIDDALMLGAGYMRSMVMGYYDNAIALWQSNPSAYWAVVDEMMADLNAKGMKIVATFLWNYLQLPHATGVDYHTMLTDPHSAPYVLGMQYITDFVNRYKNNPAIYFWELTNEANLLVDIDMLSISGDSLSTNITTEEMIAFNYRVADSIRELDPTHMISSGFGFPRSSAMHLRADTGNIWAEDTYSQYAQFLNDTHEGIDIVSVHAYNGGDHLRFGLTGTNNAGLLDYTKTITDSLHKYLYIGEYGDTNPLSIDSPVCTYSQNILDKIATLQIPFSGLWIWETYQFNTFTDQGFNVDPPYNLEFVKKFRNTNALLGNTVTPYQVNDVVKPKTMITFPATGTSISVLGRWCDQMSVSVKASDNNDTISKVEFYIDGVLATVDSIWPYRHEIDSAAMEPCDHEIIAVAYDASGNFSSDTIMLLKNPLLTCTTNIPTETRVSDDFEIYPNPVSDVLNVHYSSAIGENPVLTIYNAIGQKCIVKKLNKVNIATVDVKGLELGIYIAELGNGNVLQRKQFVITNE